MRKLVALLLACSVYFTISAQSWQQKVDYLIDVTLNDRDKSLEAFERINYYNNSPDTLFYIWFHLWPNAYKNDRTAFSDQLLENGSTLFYFSKKEERGYINRLDFKVDGITARAEDHPHHIDIIKLVLPKPLLPGTTATITTPFHVKLPYNFSRGGYDGESFQVSQWYPKPAVYDQQGWHPMPYLDQGEFYSEFGKFDVRITLPSNYVVAATGVLQNAAEKEWLHQRSAFSWKPFKKRQTPTAGKTTSKNTPVKMVWQSYPESAASTKTLQFLQDSVHDFAFFADKRFIVDGDTCLLPSGKIIGVSSYYTNGEKEIWTKSLAFIKDAVRFYSEEVGEYPYSTLSVVQGPESINGGMEYPTITIVSPLSTPVELDLVIAHEIGHNWFYGILASNERDHPWMDEGINSFYEQKYMQAKYGNQSQMTHLLNETKRRQRTSQAIETPSEVFGPTNYELVAYHKTEEWLRSIEKKLTPVLFRQMMQEYYSIWKFRHPQPADFTSLVSRYLQDSGERDAKQILDGIHQAHFRTFPKDSGFQLVSPLIKGSFNKYFQHPAKNIILISPALGVNSYDKIMIGGILSSYKAPPNKFQYLLIPFYATGSKKFRGLGKINYSIISRGIIRKTDLFVNASVFSMDEFRDTANRKLIMDFRKLVPGFRFTFREKDPRSTIHTYLEWKTFLLNEQSLKITPQTIINGTDTSRVLLYSLSRNKSYINRITWVYENYRSLYPYHINLTIDQSGAFVRPSLTANYFFNYREGGLNLRFFAGKFFYLQEKTFRKQFETDRYHLNMTGPNGYEDYSYSDYFAGRNRFEELASQQIMIRDGAFKVRTDLLADKVGKTDNWLTAINLTTTIPEKINPLSVLPVKIPIKLFLDIGTYAEAWERDAELDRFLFDAGFQISLLDDVLTIYFPILYNKEYRDYFKSTIPKNRFFKTMSFSINFYHKAFRKINRDLEF